MSNDTDVRCQSRSEDGRQCHGDEGHPGTHWAGASRVWSDTETLSRLVREPDADREIRFYADAPTEPVFTITADGVVVFGEGFGADDAARAFIAAVRQMLPEATELRVAP